MPSAASLRATPDEARFFGLLADETRRTMIRLLAVSDLRAGELGNTLRMPSNAVAYHLKQLRALGVLRERRSTADARDVYYRLDQDRLWQLYAAAGDALHPGLATFSTAPDEQPQSRMAPVRPLRVLFLCTNNSARSQLAEALMRHMGEDYVEVASAGSAPTEVHPDALAVLREWKIDASGLVAKPLQRFVGQTFDYIITVCDRVRDHCPTFPGDPRQIHWSMLDPAVVEDPDHRLAAFREVARELQTRIRYLPILPHPATGERFKLPRL
jgi:ArsR family transcriptional regulator, arsenate/arsenite/antimonite-responsive transcriptional repressor / arsenate reductase (thioredoxin)